MTTLLQETNSDTHAAQAAHGPYGSVLELVGKTPVVLAEKLSPPGRKVYVKLVPAAPVRKRGQCPDA
tara:strand:- start:177 stop:377 length:201 start_codon:yes stop_codon:yes gene_type:complete